MQKAKG